MTARRLAALAAGALVGCGAPGGDAPAVDSTLVDVLAELHLADARAALDTTAADRAGLADSLRQVAVEAHGVDPAAFDDRLDALAADPGLAQATYDAVNDRLARERQGRYGGD